jgi:hypothetical protein
MIMKTMLKLFAVLLISLSACAETKKPLRKFDPNFVVYVKPVVQAQRYVSGSLKSPGTDKFQPENQAQSWCEDEPTTVCKVESYIDAENGYGGFARREFKVSMDFDKSNNHYKLRKLIFDGKCEVGCEAEAK